MVPNKFLTRHAQRLLYVASIASDFTCVYYTASAGSAFGTTDVYKLCFSQILSPTINGGFIIVETLSVFFAIRFRVGC